MLCDKTKIATKQDNHKCLKQVHGFRRQVQAGNKE